MNLMIELKQIAPVFLVAFAIACFGLLSTVQAVSPPPDGGYAHYTTAEGDHALFSLTSGLANTAVGWYSLHDATTGSYNTGVGAGALDSNTGNENTATGVGALLLNTTGVNNTANGAFALLMNSTGRDNTAVGDRALQNNNDSKDNVAVGSQALFSHTTGDFNDAVGVFALFSDTAGVSNNAFGDAALLSNNTGTQNTGIGDIALFSNTSGNNNTALGAGAGANLTTGDNNIDIGYQVGGVAGESNTTRIGNVYDSVASARAVYVNSGNKIGTLASSRRFKEEIKPMDKASEAILALKPVMFRYKQEFDPDRLPMFGLVAEEVEKVNPDLVLRDKQGKPYSVRYDVVNAMLLNEFLKEHRKVDNLEVTVAQQRKEFQATTTQQQKKFESTIAQQQKQIEALTAGLQKVSAQIEATKPAPQVVNNP
jgi:hypothetical protein